MHPASLAPSVRTAGVEPAASSSSSAPAAPRTDAEWSARYASLPDLFLPRDGSPSLGYADPKQKGKGAGVVLDAERAGASFDSNELMLLLYGGKKKLARRRFLHAAVENEPVFRRWDSIFLSRPERMRRSREKGAAIVRLIRDLGVEDPMELSQLIAHVGEGLPSELHRSMFVPTLLSQASEEQQAQWLPLALNFATLGTYAQTELGHGSFVRGMETTATFDPSTDSFVCTTPTLTATKWWPGNLGQNTTHCVLMARCIANGADHGVHAFLLPLRDPQTYLPYPGVTTGDIGPKVGYESNDNGFLRLDRVRIPRGNMLARFARVTKEGVYERVPGSHAKAAFGTMVFVRSMIVVYAARYLSMALTIAIRYSAVRRQFPHVTPGLQGETPVLDYQTQQYLLFPLLATAHAFHFTGSFMRRLYEQNRRNLAEGNTGLMAELHATSSGLKALTTTLTSEGIETARKSCGGHGYSRFCGISDIWVDYVPAQTYEGDNIVMFLQTARSLIKTFSRVRAGKVRFEPGAHSHYMHAAAAKLAAASSAAAAGKGAEESKQQPERSTLRASDLDEGNPAGPAALRALYAHRVARLLLQAVGDLGASAAAHPSWNAEQHWEVCKVALVSLARAHCMHVLVCNFQQALDSMERKSRVTANKAKWVHAPPAAAASTGSADSEEGHRSAHLSPSILRVLWRLCDLFTLYYIERDLGDFAIDGFLSEEQFQLIRCRILRLLALIRPDAVALVDAMDFSDHYLNSALGRYDGDVYACMMEWTQRSSINAQRVGTGIEEFTMPMLREGEARAQAQVEEATKKATTGKAKL